MISARILLVTVGVLVVSSVWAQSSREGEFFAEVTIRGGAGHYPDVNHWTATVFDHDGVQRYQIAKEIPYDVPYPAIHLSDGDGRCVLISAFTGSIEFFDGHGTLQRTLLPFGERTADFEQIVKCSVAGDRAAFLISTPSGQRAGLFLTDLEGNEMWRSTVNEKFAAEILLSSDGRYVLAGSYSSDPEIVRSTKIFSGEGKLFRTFDMLFRHADISTAGVVLADRNNVYFVSLDGTGPPASWSSERKEDVVTAVKVAGGYVAAAVENVTVETGAPVYHNPSLILLNHKGEMVAKRTLSGDSKTPVSLEFDGAAVTLISEQSRTRLEIQQLDQQR